MRKFYSIRVVKAESKEEAVEKVELNHFDESDPLCDKVVTLKELAEYAIDNCDVTIKFKAKNNE